jgi:hypothetical protein
VVRRSTYLRYESDIEIKAAPARIWGHDKQGRFVCRLEINNAGVEVFAGAKGNKRLKNVTWEQLVELLRKP